MTVLNACLHTFFGLFYEYVDFFPSLLTRLHCLVGCLSIIVWTHDVLGVLYACVLYFCISTCSEQSSMCHMERQSRSTIIIIRQRERERGGRGGRESWGGERERERERERENSICRLRLLLVLMLLYGVAALIAFFF